MKRESMARFYHHLSILILCVLLIVPAAVFSMEQIAKVQSGTRPSYVTDELLVKFKPEVEKTQHNLSRHWGLRKYSDWGKNSSFHESN
jgi:hypothetical protein